MRARPIFLGGLLAMALALPSCGTGSASPSAVAPPRSATLAQLIEGAKKESTLKGVWAESSFGGNAGFQEMVAGMNKKYGLHIKGQFTPGPDMQSLMGKLAQEAAAGQPATTDVYLGNAPAAQQAVKPKALKPLDWNAILDRPIPAEPGFDPVWPGGIAVAFASTVTGVTYNSNLVKGQDIPHHLADLLNPKWKGKIASTPYAAGLREFASKDLLGKDVTIEFTRKLSKQIGGLLRCGNADRISSGEFLMLAPDCGNDGAFVAQRQGAPIAQVILDDVTSLHLRFAGVPATSSSPNAAGLLIAYLGTPEGQRLIYKYGGMDLHTYPESRMKGLVDKVRASGGKVAADSAQWLASFPDYAQTQELLQDILQKGLGK